MLGRARRTAHHKPLSARNVAVHVTPGQSPGPGSPRAGLLERDAQLAEIDDAVAAARAGAGRVLLLAGGAGLGKTSLLDEARRRAVAAGLEVRAARGDELESGVPWGVAVQLFGDVPDDPDAQRLFRGAAGLSRPLFSDAAVPDGRAPDPFPLLHGLHWLTARLAERSPLMLAVDDAHWSDPDSLAFLNYLLGRLDELAVVVVLAARRDSNGDAASGGPARELLARIAAIPATRVAEVPPLADGSIRALVARRLPHAEPEFESAVASAVAGSPFLCRELLDAVAAEEIEPTAAGAARLGRLRPEGVRSSIAVRLGRLGPDAGALAAAVAVLRRAATPQLAAEQAGLSEAETRAALDALCGADILVPGPPLAFTHPIVGEVVYAEIRPGRLRGAHGRAARLLRDRAAPPEEVAAHLLLGDADGEPWAGEVLREAAATAAARGAAGRAAELLRRALDEPGASDDPALLIELGRTEVALGDPGGLERLRAAASRATEPAVRGAALATLGIGRYAAGDQPGAVESLREALAQIPPGAGGQPEGELVVAVGMYARAAPGTLDTWRAVVEPSRLGPGGEPTAAEYARRAARAFGRILFGDREGAIEDLDWATAHPDVGPPEIARTSLTFTQAFLGRHDEAERIATGLIGAARERGDRLGVAIGLEARAQSRMLRGDLAGVMADSEAALELVEQRWDVASLTLRVARCRALVERGLVAEAREAIDLPEEVEAMVPGSWGWFHLPFGRAAVALAAGDPRAAVTQATLAGERLLATEVLDPDYLPWRRLAARALVAAGEPDAAVAMLREELAAAAETGARRSLGAASALLGALEGGDGAAARVEEAVGTLDACGAALDAARARLELGRLLRRRRRAREARGPLAAAADAATRLGASVLAEEALGELGAAGGRPRRTALRGVHALTEGQLRVVQFAARGMSNREIAEALFVTVRTVETHLTAAYGKLGISSRAELGQALAQQAPAP